MSESTDFRQGEAPGWKPGMTPDTSRGTGRSLIGPTVVIRGQVSAEEDLLIMGRVEGFIDHSRTVTIHADGTIAAEVKAQEVLVEGRVDGNVYGTRRVQIAESGSVNGNVYAPRVGVLEGANFKGAIDMEADVSVIERRFREATGSEAPVSREVGAGKPAKAELEADTAKGDSDAAQADEEGLTHGASDAAVGSSGTGAGRA
ncbi:MAG: polymer-forming cytoskeletal protein [Pseudomonadales bacterium]